MVTKVVSTTTHRWIKACFDIDFFGIIQVITSWQDYPKKSSKLLKIFLSLSYISSQSDTNPPSGDPSLPRRGPQPKHKSEVLWSQSRSELTSSIKSQKFYSIGYTDATFRPMGFVTLESFYKSIIAWPTIFILSTYWTPINRGSDGKACFK